MLGLVDQLFDCFAAFRILNACCAARAHGHAGTRARGLTGTRARGHAGSDRQPAIQAGSQANKQTDRQRKTTEHVASGDRADPCGLVSVPACLCPCPWARGRRVDHSDRQGSLSWVLQGINESTGGAPLTCQPIRDLSARIVAQTLRLETHAAALPFNVPPVSRCAVPKAAGIMVRACMNLRKGLGTQKSIGFGCSTGYCSKDCFRHCIRCAVAADVLPALVAFPLLPCYSAGRDMSKIQPGPTFGLKIVLRP